MAVEHDFGATAAVFSVVWSHDRLPEEVRDVSLMPALTDGRVPVVATPARYSGRWAWVSVPPTISALDAAAELAVGMCWFESSYA